MKKIVKETTYQKVKIEINNFVNEHKADIIMAVGTLGMTVLNYYEPNIFKSTQKHITNTTVFTHKKSNSSIDIQKAVNPIINNREPTYIVQFKAFKTGTWYTKTKTDYINSAYSVAACNSYGRAYKIIDSRTGTILKEALEDASMASCNGYPNRYH